jgi:hypothetical protein
VLFGPSAAILQAYDAQFGEENGQLVYRRSGKGEAYRITPDRYEDLRAAYIRDYRRLYAIFTASVVATMLAVLAGMVILDVAPDGPGYYVILGTTIAVLLAVFVYSNQRALTAPAQLLEGMFR